jgi:hypothetical protein
MEIEKKEVVVKKVAKKKAKKVVKKVAPKVESKELKFVGFSPVTGEKVFK